MRIFSFGGNANLSFFAKRENGPNNELIKRCQLFFEKLLNFGLNQQTHKYTKKNTKSQWVIPAITHLFYYRYVLFDVFVKNLINVSFRQK